MRKSGLIIWCMAALSLAVGFLVFSAGKYRMSTLVIKAKTVQMGLGTVYVDGETGSSVRHFEVDDDTGAEKRYVIELPATRLRSLRIAPLADRGKFEISRITLANDSISYTWDEQGGCSQRMVVNDTVRREPCSGSFPEIATAEDSSVAISSLPDTGAYNSIHVRLSASFACALALFLGGVWLLRPTEGTRHGDDLRQYAARAAWLALLVLYLYQFFLIWKYAVDVPNSDEWYYFSVDALPIGLNWKWLFSYSNEHIRVFTHLLAWLNLQLFGLDFAKGLIFNYLVFGLLILAIVRVKERIVGRDAFPLFPVFLIFLMSPIDYQNHTWGVCLAIHLVLLFSVLALCYAYGHEVTKGKAMVFSLLMVLGIYNFSGAGMVFAAVYLVCNTVYVAANIVGKRVGREAGGTFLLLSYGIIGLGMALWFLGYRKPEWSQPMVSLVSHKFWNYFLNVLSLGFGFTSEQLIPGIVCLLVTIVPLILLLLRSDTRWQPSTWHVVSAILGILAVMTVISMGRTELTPAKTSRYAEFGFLLIPYAAIAWWLTLKNRVARYVVLSSIWIFCLVSYADTWFFQLYPEVKQENLDTLECVELYYKGIGDGACQENEPAHRLNRTQQVERARQLKVNFTKQFETKQIPRSAD